MTNGLVKTLLTLIREQRHLAMRVIVSTQGKVVVSHHTHSLTPASEPTVIPPIILNLCMVMILHRFSSPEWWEHVKRHVCAEISGNAVFHEIAGLDRKSVV